MAHTKTAALLLCLLPWFGYGVEGQRRQQTASKLDTGLKMNPCPPGWDGLKDRCFQYIANKKAWLDSELHCLSIGGNLASIHSEQEFQFIKALIKRNDSAEKPTWIGLTEANKPLQKGIWLWTDESKVDFTKWNRGEPTNLKGEDCVHTNWGRGKGWNDISCDSSYAFVCARRSGV